MVSIPVSVGEMIDKLSILQVKKIKVSNEEKLEFINKEFELLHNFSSEYLNNLEIELIYAKLILVNTNLWDIEDKLRILEKEKKFDTEFIASARKVYFTNDEKFMNTVGKKNKSIVGLQMYLEGRQTIIAELEKNRAITGVQGLDTKANEKFADWRDRMAEYIIAQNPEFEQMYTRYLSQDELNIVDSPLLNGVK